MASRPSDPGVQRLLHGLPIDRVHERAPHADIVERRLGHVDVEPLLTAGTPPVHDRAHLPDLGVEIGGDRLGVDEVERPLFEADQLGRILGHVEPVHLVDLGPAASELVERLQHDLLARGVPVEVEGPGPDRVPLVLLARLVHRLLRDDVALLIADHPEREDRIEGLEGDLHRIRDR